MVPLVAILIHKSSRDSWALTAEDHAVEPRPISDFDSSDAQDFERLLRLSVRHESQRCISRWSYCGSFRIILALIVLFCSRQPLDEDELNDFCENYLEPLVSFAGSGRRKISAFEPKRLR